MSGAGDDDPLAGVTPLGQARPPDPPEMDGFDDPAPPTEDAALAERLTASAAEPLNDFGNGRRLSIHFGEDLMFVPRVGWFVWSGRAWIKDGDLLEVRARAQRIWALIERETAYLQTAPRERELILEERTLKRARAETADEAASNAVRLRQIGEELKPFRRRLGKHLSHARTAGNNGPITHMIAESSTGLARPLEQLDADPLAVNAANGLLRFRVTDLRGDGAGRVADVSVEPHAREQMQSKLLAASYNPEAACPTFDAFMARIQPDIEARQFLQRWFGLSMTGIKTPKLAFFFGSGANGKSVLVDLVARILDGYAASLRIESLTGTNRRSGAEATPDLIPLLGARFVRTSEPDQGERLQEGLVKMMTGGEPIPVRPNYGEQIDLNPVFKLTISGNHKPEIRGTDDGIWRRVLLVPFPVQIPEAERDEALPEKLWAERDGVLGWLVEGLMDYLEGGLRPPDTVLAATEEYREESDPIGHFLTTCCVVTGEASDILLARELGEMFNFHLVERGLSQWKPTTFAKQISERSRRFAHPVTGATFAKAKSSLSQYTGIRLTETFQRRFERRNYEGTGTAAPHPSTHALDDDLGG